MPDQKQTREFAAGAILAMVTFLGSASARSQSVMETHQEKPPVLSTPVTTIHVDPVDLTEVVERLTNDLNVSAVVSNQTAWAGVATVAACRIRSVLLWFCMPSLRHPDSVAHLDDFYEVVPPITTGKLQMAND